MSVQRALASRPRDVEPRPRGRGGIGTRYPTSTDELIDLLQARGPTIERTRGKHTIIRYRGRNSPILSTPSEYHSLQNTIKELERELGIDLRRDAYRR